MIQAILLLKAHPEISLLFLTRLIYTKTGMKDLEMVLPQCGSARDRLGDR